MGTQHRNASPSPEARLATIAEQAHGVVDHTEARSAGLSARQIHTRVRNGYLHAVHRGVYRLGHRAPSALADYMAATKACGSGSALSGLAAARLLQLVRRQPPVIEVTAPSERRVPGLRVHRTRITLRATQVHGIPVVTPAWALLDIAGRLNDEDLGWACHHAMHRHGVTPDDVALLLSERGAVKGSRRLMAILGGDDPLLLSRLETAFLRLLRAERRQLPLTNRREREGFVDCRWPGLALVVELDSYRFHNSRRSWERDRERDRAARQRGDELIRYTWRDVVDDAAAVRAEMRSRLPSAAKRS